MTAKECITGRRSIRKFTDQPVSHQLLEQIIATASYAPSWKNTQITRYLAVEGDAKERLAACANAHNSEIMQGAPLVMAVSAVCGQCGFDKDGSASTFRGDAWQMFDAGVACEAFCLAAHEQGLGTVIMGIFDQEAASQLLEIPREQDLIALIAVGYPAQTPTAPRRKAVEELLSYRSH